MKEIWQKEWVGQPGRQRGPNRVGWAEGPVSVRLWRCWSPCQCFCWTQPLQVGLRLSQLAKKAVLFGRSPPAATRHPAGRQARTYAPHKLCRL